MAQMDYSGVCEKVRFLYFFVLTTVRIAFFVFALDSTSTLVFGNQPLLYVTDVSMPLLAEEHHWEAENFEVWAAQKPTIEPPTILHMLKAFVQCEQCESPLPKLSPWNMLLLLHGLLSVDISLKQKKFGKCRNHFLYF